MKENEMTIRLNEASLLEILKSHYKDNGFEICDHQFYEDKDFIYAEVRMKEDKNNFDGIKASRKGGYDDYPLIP